MRIHPTNVDRIAVRVTELEKALTFVQSCANTLPSQGPASLVPGHLLTVREALHALKVDLSYLSCLAMAAAQPAPVLVGQGRDGSEALSQVVGAGVAP